MVKESHAVWWSIIAIVTGYLIGYGMFYHSDYSVLEKYKNKELCENLIDVRRCYKVFKKKDIPLK